MYAVIKTGGKQYRGKEGDTLKVEKITGDAGASVEFNDVLAIGDGDAMKIGTPTVKGAKVLAEVINQGRAKKVLVFKKKKRKGYTKKQGHRQAFTALKIKEIRG